MLLAIQPLPVAVLDMGPVLLNELNATDEMGTLRNQDRSLCGTHSDELVLNYWVSKI